MRPRTDSGAAILPGSGLGSDSGSGSGSGYHPDRLMRCELTLQPRRVDDAAPPGEVCAVCCGDDEALRLSRRAGARHVALLAHRDAEWLRHAEEGLQPIVEARARRGETVLRSVDSVVAQEARVGHEGVPLRLHGGDERQDGALLRRVREVDAAEDE